MPAWAQIAVAFEQARDAARGTGGTLRLGWPPSVSGPTLSGLTEAFSATFPECELTIHDVPVTGLYGPVRRGETDVMVFWLVMDEPDFTLGPVLEYRGRALAVGSGHRLARRETVSVEDLADEQIHQGQNVPAAVFDALVPPVTPSGRPIPRTVPWRSNEQITALIARGRLVHPTVADVSAFRRDDIRLIPIRDLPPLPLGLIWRAADENARIRALADVARKIGPAAVAPE